MQRPLQLGQNSALHARWLLSLTFLLSHSTKLLLHPHAECAVGPASGQSLPGMAATAHITHKVMGPARFLCASAALRQRRRAAPASHDSHGAPGLSSSASRRARSSEARRANSYISGPKFTSRSTNDDSGHSATGDDDGGAYRRAHPDIRDSGDWPPPGSFAALMCRAAGKAR